MILIFGGTSDSLEFAEILNDMGEDYVLSVATDYGENLAKPYAKNIVAKRMDEIGIEKYIKENNIDLVLDMTHPYAVEVSKNVIDACENTGAKYMRFERARLIEYAVHDNLHLVKDYPAAVEFLNSRKDLKRVFLGTGSNNLELFCKELVDKEIFPRVIPSPSIIEKCTDLGISYSNIVAMQGPYSTELNMGMLNHFDCDVLVTKESGASGGFIEKVEACTMLGIDAVIIDRPKIDYPRMVDNYEDLREFVKENR